MNLVAKWNKKCQYDEGFVWNYDYTGGEQTFTVPCEGEYKIELWGAAGGTVLNISNGKGAYTSGQTKLKYNKYLYIYVGGQGVSDTQYEPTIESTNAYRGVGKTNAGGWNGGGSGGYDGIKHGIDSAGGGGATDIRLASGTWNNFNSLKSRIMVAAGGGGAYGTTYSNSRIPSDSSNGGGLTGYGGYSSNTADSNKYGFIWSSGGTQIAGGIISNYSLSKVATNGSFGIGGKSNSNENAWAGGGGGSGYYGGSGGTFVTEHWKGYASNGAGGSSYISGHNGCNAIDENGIHTGQSVHYSGLKFTKTQMIDGAGYNWTTIKENYVGQIQPDGTTTTGHSGNGYARITLVSLD